MKIEEGFRDLKSLLGLERMRKRERMEKMIPLLKHKVELRHEEMVGLLRRVWEFFRRLVHGLASLVRIQV